MNRRFLAAAALALSAACAEHPTAVSVGRQAAVPRLNVMAQTSATDYVVTPEGLFHAECVHQIPNGARVDINGHVTRTDGTTYQLPRCPYASDVSPANEPR